MTHLASDLLLLARADSNQLVLDRRMFRFDELVVECISQLHGLAKSKNIGFTVTLDSAVELHGDEVLLRRAIINVLDNALKFSPAQSSVSVAVNQLDDHVELIIQDKGTGIPSEDLPFMFDRFRRADIARTTKGTGLGLAIAKAIIDAHHGALHITSELGAGTTIRFSLPV